MNGKKLDFDTREKRLVMCGIFALLLLLPFMAAVPGVLAKVADDIEDMLVKDITSMSGGIGTEIKTILLETKLSSSVTDAFSTGVKGVANVLTGQAAFTGRLPMPWYGDVSEIGTDKCLFPVGYGLSAD